MTPRVQTSLTDPGGHRFTRPTPGQRGCTATAPAANYPASRARGRGPRRSERARRGERDAERPTDRPRNRIPVAAATTSVTRGWLPPLTTGEAPQPRTVASLAVWLGLETGKVPLGNAPCTPVRFNSRGRLPRGRPRRSPRRCSWPGGTVLQRCHPCRHGSARCTCDAVVTTKPVPRFRAGHPAWPTQRCWCSRPCPRRPDHRVPHALRAPTRSRHR